MNHKGNSILTFLWHHHTKILKHKCCHSCSEPSTDFPFTLRITSRPYSDLQAWCNHLMVNSTASLLLSLLQASSASYCSWWPRHNPTGIFHLPFSLPEMLLLPLQLSPISYSSFSSNVFSFQRTSQTTPIISVSLFSKFSNLFLFILFVRLCQVFVAALWIFSLRYVNSNLQRAC